MKFTFVRVRQTVTTSEYLNGHKVNLPIWIRDKRGHDLTTIIRECFRNGEKYLLSRKPEESVLILTAKLPGFIPKDLTELFVSLAS